VVCDSNGSDSGVKNGGDQRGDGNWCSSVLVMVMTT